MSEEWVFISLGLCSLGLAFLTLLRAGNVGFVDRINFACLESSSFCQVQDK